MRRLLLTAAALLASGAIGSVAPSTAHAALYTYRGAVVDDNGGDPLGGIVVTATPPAGAGPAVTVVTSGNGRWSFDSDLDEYQLSFDGGTAYQSGYRSCAGMVTPTLEFACTNGPFGGSISTRMFATWARGRIVDSETGRGVAGATVEARWPDAVTPIASDVTDGRGYYRITGIATDEISLHVDGSVVGYSSGWFACASGVVVPTWGESCTHAPGAQGVRAIDRLVPLVLRVASRAPGAITLTVALPIVGSPSGSVLTCAGPSGLPVSRTYPGNGGTETGFEQGWNTCMVRAAFAAAPGPPSEPFRVRVR